MKLTLEKPAVEETVHTSLMKECLTVRQCADGIMLCGICTVKREVFFQCSVLDSVWFDTTSEKQQQRGHSYWPVDKKKRN